eukprot:TRINITY_DN12335_c0_g1_i1.p1 TRINITY_DN12335_c0_g1~~TRINITY_DN12335_c0_g1_i1.p1  ORF type:complete len:555 (-),score=108.62 TRINITY_DN12335_c0_g1_i1:50-1714(-)
MANVWSLGVLSCPTRRSFITLLRTRHSALSFLPTHFHLSRTHATSPITHNHNFVHRDNLKVKFLNEDYQDEDEGEGEDDEGEEEEYQEDEEEEDLQEDEEDQKEGEKWTNVVHQKIGIVNLPEFVTAKITRLLKGSDTKTLKEQTKLLSDRLRYRGKMLHLQLTKPTSPTVITAPVIVPLTYDKAEALSYVALRLPGIYATNIRIFQEISNRFPEFTPRTMLDFGSGPGTSIWAATQTWKSSINKIVAIEPSENMNEISKYLLKGSKKSEIVEYQRYLFTSNQPRGNSPSLNEAQYDLVVASYSLNELQSSRVRAGVLRGLWDRVNPTGGVLVLIESGTSLGFSIIREARELLLSHRVSSNHAQILAPCPHREVCPMPEGSWCHFSQRVARDEFQRRARGVSGWQDEKYSFVALRKNLLSQNTLRKTPTTTDQPSATPPPGGFLMKPKFGARDNENFASGVTSGNQVQENQEEVDLEKKLSDHGFDSLPSRVVRRPQRRSGHVIFRACSHDGSLQKHLTTRSNRIPFLYRNSRKMDWGDMVHLHPSTRREDGRS